MRPRLKHAVDSTVKNEKRCPSIQNDSDLQAREHKEIFTFTEQENSGPVQLSTPPEETEIISDNCISKSLLKDHNGIHCTKGGIPKTNRKLYTRPGKTKEPHDISLDPDRLHDANEKNTDSQNKRVLRNRDKSVKVDKFEALKTARKLRQRRKEDKENVENHPSPEIMRSGRRNTKMTSEKPQRRVQQTSPFSESEELRKVAVACPKTESISKECESSLDENFNIGISENDVKLEHCSLAHSDEVTKALESVQEDLYKALGAISHHPPSIVYNQINLLLAVVQNNLGSQLQNEHNLKIAYHLSLSLGATIRHQSLCSLQKRKTASFDVPDYSDKLSRVRTCDEARQNILSFQSLEADNVPQLMQACLDILPEDWTVIQVSGASVWQSVKDVNANKTPYLMVGHYRAKSSPVLTLVSPNDTRLRNGFLKEFADIMDSLVKDGKQQEPKAWWSHRFSLDKRMQNLCSSMENIWLGCWKCLFFGKPTSEKYIKCLEEATKALLMGTKSLGLPCTNESMLKCLLDGMASHQVESRQVASAIHYLFGVLVSKQKPILDIIQSLGLEKFPDTQRKPVILILDKMVHKLPWESMPFLKDCPVFRMPSLQFLLSQLVFQSKPNTDSVFLNGVRGSNTFYVLNPSKDLLKTEDFFKDKLAQIPDWRGTVSEVPTKEQVLSAVVDFDCYLYLGHGSGRVYLCKEILQSYPCRAAVILMGCSSVKLKSSGVFEPTGGVFQYLMGGCPAVMGNLWDVTDRDIDKFTEGVIQKWLLAESGTSMTTGRTTGRLLCKLKHLTGAAPVIYGLPVYTS